MKLPKEVKEALETLEAAGYEAVLAGGCVRDFLLGKEPHDFDIATSARPEETKAVFADRPVIETGIRHGTVTVCTEGYPLEITTYRSDGAYSDGRHPDNVHFTRRLEDDLARRDFTVNAMAYHLRRGVIDIFNGRLDLEQRRIRAVGIAWERFTEDSLRIMRALRFSSVLGFTIEAGTAEAAHALKDRLALISAERVFAELKKLLCGQDAGRVLSEYPDILGVWLPEILPMANTDWEHTVKVTEATPALCHLRLAALFHDSGHFDGHHRRSASIAETCLARLKADNDTKHKVITLICCLDTPLEADPRSIKRMFFKLRPDLFFDLISLQRADNLGEAPAFRGRRQILDKVETIAKKVLSEKACFSLKDLAVSGSDLIALGMEPGPAIGQTLHVLLEAVIDGRLPNEKERLLESVRP